MEVKVISQYRGGFLWTCKYSVIEALEDCEINKSGYHLDKHTGVVAIIWQYRFKKGEKRAVKFSKTRQVKVGDILDFETVRFLFPEEFSIGWIFAEH